MAERALSLREVVNKSPGRYQLVTLLDNKVFWTNGQIAVRDDARFIKYFGRNFLDKTIEEGDMHMLNSAGKKLLIEESVGKSVSESLKSYFNKDLSTLPALSISSDGVFLNKGLCLVREDRTAGVLVDKDYYTHLSRIGFDSLSLDQEKKHTPIVYFGYEGEAKAILAVRVPDAEGFEGPIIDADKLREIGALPQ